LVALPMQIDTNYMLIVKLGSRTDLLTSAWV
jgi:hypothetical protein